MASETDKKHLISLLTIGTEITSGQIANKHAVWLSQQLNDLGFEVFAHLSVPDEAEAIQAALRFLAPQAETMIVTGGLGPTRDDITRTEIASWMNRPLILQEKEWRVIEAFLLKRGVSVSSLHPSQAMIPQGSTVLENSVGTAVGFRAFHDNCEAWVLPGPTPEMQTMWKRYVLPALQTRAPHGSLKLKTWRCLGKPESELADLVEKVVESTGLKTGYRLATPYVEVKVWTPEKPNSRQVETLAELDRELAPWALARDSEDLAEIFLKRALKIGPVTIIDDVTEGAAAERLFPLARLWALEEAQPPLRILASTHPDLQGLGFDGPGLTVKFENFQDPLSWRVSVNSSTLQQNSVVKFDALTRFKGERLAKARCELSLFEVLKWLR